MKRRAVLLMVFVWMVNGASAAELALHDGFSAAAKTFGDLREHLSTIVQEPSERTQVAQSLTKLSQRLDSLVLAKLTLTESLVNAKWPQDRKKITAAAEAFRDQLHKCRFALTDVFALLSPEWQMRGGDLQAQIEWRPRASWQSLDEVAQDVGATGASADQLRAESDALVALVRQLKEVVDGMATGLAKPGS